MLCKPLHLLLSVPAARGKENVLTLPDALYIGTNAGLLLGSKYAAHTPLSTRDTCCSQVSWRPGVT